MKKKILFVHHAGEWGGAPMYMTNIIKALDKSKYDIKVVLLKQSPDLINRLKGMGINCVCSNEKFFNQGKAAFAYCEWSNWRLHTLIIIIYYWILAKFMYIPKELEKYDYDILVLNSSCLTAWLKSNHKRGKRSIIHVQEPLRQRRLNPIYSFMFKRQIRKYADSVIAITEDNAKRTGVFDKTIISRNFAPVPSTDAFPESYSSKKVLYLGGSQAIKGFCTLIDALPYLDENVVVYIGGYISEPVNVRGIKGIIKALLKCDKRMNEACERLKYADNVKLIGMTNDVHTLLDEVCCLVSPFSKPHFSRPVIEAYLHKKAAIVTNIAGINEYVMHKRTGLIVPNNNSMKLADAINYICSHPVEAKELGENGYCLAIKYYTEEANVQVACSEYERVASLIRK
ncbi:glycosyltransferase family 4 protein [Odoribacter laneus]|uniref:Glycosyl transferase family 1 domain-containing protein n=1 Tax=Odoribacter laneus YIT 12061 TaxID=742817 RepID=H1DFA3_9BACT|nr:glycosyltransferase family 4 protein [Odoribacter laneus]EHP49421.1 hypothetical protein HMPREF9449_00939 [Odoribacter laneus YIT 12061]